MGGDFAPARMIDGALAAVRHQGVSVDLVGRVDAIEAELARHPDAAALSVRIIEAPDVIETPDTDVEVEPDKPDNDIDVDVTPNNK